MTYTRHCLITFIIATASKLQLQSASNNSFKKFAAIFEGFSLLLSLGTYTKAIKVHIINFKKNGRKEKVLYTTERERRSSQIKFRQFF